MEHVLGLLIKNLIFRLGFTKKLFRFGIGAWAEEEQRMMGASLKRYITDSLEGAEK